MTLFAAPRLRKFLRGDDPRLAKPWAQLRSLLRSSSPLCGHKDFEQSPTASLWQSYPVHSYTAAALPEPVSSRPAAENSPTPQSRCGRPLDPSHLAYERTQVLLRPRGGTECWRVAPGKLRSSSTKRFPGKCFAMAATLRCRRF